MFESFRQEKFRHRAFKSDYQINMLQCKINLLACIIRTFRIPISWQVHDSHLWIILSRFLFSSWDVENCKVCIKTKLKKKCYVSSTKYILVKGPLRKAILAISSMRPVVSFVSAPAHKLAKYLDIWFKRLVDFRPPFSKELNCGLLPAHPPSTHTWHVSCLFSRLPHPPQLVFCEPPVPPWWRHIQENVLSRKCPGT